MPAQKDRKDQQVFLRFFFIHLPPKGYYFVCFKHHPVFLTQVNESEWTTNTFFSIKITENINKT
jgi:hypothetical protein